MFTKIVIPLMMLVFLSKVCSGQDYIKTPFNSSSGLYYENVGKVLLSNNNWKFVTYVDYKGYLLFFEYLKRQASKLEDFCRLSELDYCKERFVTIEDSVKELEKIDENMAIFLGLDLKKRRKRSWEEVIPAVVPLLQPLAEGLSNKLFGNKGMPDLSVYDNEIQLLKQNSEHLRNQFEMQSTVFKIDSEKKAEDIESLKLTQIRIEQELKIQEETIQRNSVEKEEKIADLQSLLNECRKNIDKQKEDQEKSNNEIIKLRESVTSIESNLKLLKIQTNQNKNQIDAVMIETQLNKIKTDFNFLLARFQAEQKTLYDSLINANKGNLDPYIITPLNLIEMMLKVLPNLQEDYKFPFYPNFVNSRKLYKLIKPSFHLYNGSIIWLLEINLVKTNTYNLYKMTSFPVPVSPNTFAFIIPQQPFMLIDPQENEHTFVSDANFHISCENIEIGLFLCTRIQTNPVYESLDCEIQIFLNRKIDYNQCQIRLMPLKEPVFFQILKFKTWIYATPNPQDIIVRCNKVRTPLKISNTGFLQLGNCTAVGKHDFLQAYKDSKLEKIYGNYSSTVNIRNFIKINSVLPAVSVKRNIGPFDFDYLQRSSIDLKNIPKGNTSNETLSKDLKNSIIIVATLFVVITIVVTITLVRDKLLNLGKLFTSKLVSHSAITA